MNSLPARENRHRRGAALLLVMFIALGAILAMVALFAVMSSRQFSVKGGAVSDRALAMSDAGVDRIVEMINTTGMSFSSPVVTANGSTPPTTTATQQVIAQLLAGINGGSYDSSQSDGGLSTISANVRRYFYNVSSNSYYRLESGTLASGTLTDLSTGATVTDTPTTGLAGDLAYQTDNLWFEMDANATYHYDQTNPDTWVLKVTAFNLATPAIQRTVKAEVGRGDVNVNTGTTTTTTQTANGNWYTRNTVATTTTHWFSDFSGMYHTKTAFGKYEVTQGMIRSDSDLYMGGWAKDPVYASGHVYDTAIDDGNRSDGAFGVSLTDKTKPAGNLSWAKSQNPPYATDHYATANFNNGTKFLTGSTSSRNTSDANGGMQDVAAPSYYVGKTSSHPTNPNGDATIVFGSAGTVTITPVGGSATTLPMPTNGIIYVEGTATVSGTVLGRASVGAGDDIDIGGNILYNTAPRINRTDAQPAGAPDSLGLVAMNNVVITTSTYANNRTLEIDSAMMAVNGWFGIDPNAPTHNMDVTPHYVGIWNGAQAVWSGDNAPAVSTGGSNERGYEEQHTNFDYNLLEYGPPPMYPPSDTTTSPVSVTTYDLVSDVTLLGTLRGIDKSALTPITSSDPTYDPNNACYYLDYNGHRYYFGPSFNVNSVTQSTAQAVYSGQALSLYRVSWKEQITQPVVP